jgi:hypothetical protein
MQVSDVLTSNILCRSEKNVELYNKGAKRDEKMQGSIRIIVGKCMI